MKMKKFIVTLTTLMTVILLLMTGCSTTASKEGDVPSKTTEKTVKDIIAAGKLKVGSKADVKNYGFLDTATNEYQGFEIDISYAIAGKIFGVSAEEAREKKLVEFTGTTAKTRGPLVDNGDVDMVAATVTITDERKESWNFSTPYIQDAIGVLTLKSYNFTSVKDFDGCIIGVQMGATAKNALDKYLKTEAPDIEVNIQEFNTYPDAIAALNAGQIQGLCTDRSILSSYLDDKTALMPDKFSPQDYGVMTKLENKEFAKFVDSVIVEMNNSGEMSKLIAKWGLDK